ncbi:hypothetical protein CDO52_07415 [Nocardiopsis gilva YIM 90087]|uniref:Uncharacterized protein n=1 Tax=Nocardiopsis gilva YIM 90087 TaxID=1235441 RepID=A0A223S3D7_9ACTN|nr:hypothetical protein CDO52_07415 [Nocardiopsis gilva YIM 90087]
MRRGGCWRRPCACSRSRAPASRKRRRWRTWATAESAGAEATARLHAALRLYEEIHTTSAAERVRKTLGPGAEDDGTGPPRAV